MFAKSLKINDTHRKKLCFTQFSTRMAASLGCLAAWLLLTFFFMCFHKQLSSIHSISPIKEHSCLKHVIQQKEQRFF